MPQRIRRHVTFANVTAMVALVFAMGGTGYALSIPNNSVGTKQIKRNGVSNSDIRANAVTSAKVKDRSLKAVDFAVGQLPAGPPGVVANVIVRRVDIVLPAGAGAGVPGAITSGFATCAAGEKIIGGSVNISNATEPPQMEVLVSRPSVDNVGNGVVPVDGGTFAFWKGTAHTKTNVVGAMRVFAICAPA